MLFAYCSVTWHAARVSTPRSLADTREGIVNLLSLSGVMGMVGVGRAGSHDPFQATVAVAVPVIWFQMMNRSVIVRRYSAAESR